MLYNYYAPTMFAICTRYANCRPEAEDISQEVWIRIFQKLDTYGFTGSLEGWMRRVAVSVALRTIQKRVGHFEELDSGKSDDLSVEPGVFSKLSADDLLEQIHILPEGYKAVFNLHAVEGYSHDEIGEQLGITPSTSRSQLTKARRLLQSRLSKLLLICL